jgi:hypothetical protein
VTRRSTSIVAACLALTACRKPVPGPQECAELPGRATPLRLLTRVEYDRTVHDLLGDDLQLAQATFPREPVTFAFDNNADAQQATPEAVGRYLEAAETLARATVAGRRARLETCTSEDLACGHRFVEVFGRKAFRRSLTVEEQTVFTGLFDSTYGAEGFDAALTLTVEAFLQSPQFLYRTELGDGSSPAPASVPLTGVELASKLSYFLWQSMPDDALLDVAEAGGLDTTAGLEAQVERMLADPRATPTLARIVDQLFETAAVARLEKDPATYPAFTPALAGSLETTLELFIAQSLADDGTLHGLLTTPRLSVDANMTMYEPPVPGSGFTMMLTSPADRVGVLTQPGFLARLSGPNQSSPIRRGIFVLDRLMCQPPQPPPGAMAAVVPPPLDPTATTRERFAAHTADPACQGCHASIDPLGFGFEHYDGIGVTRDTENGKPVDASGAVVGARDPALEGPFSSVAELAERLGRSRQVSDCMAAHLFRYALGRVEQQEDACSLDAARARFAGSQGRFAELQRAIIGSASFRTRTPPVEVTP